MEVMQIMMRMKIIYIDAKKEKLKRQLNFLTLCFFQQH